MFNIEVWLIIVPLICSTFVGILFFVLAKTKKLAIMLSLIITIIAIACIIAIDAKNRLENNMFENKYVKVNIEGLMYKDFSNYEEPCDLKIYENYYSEDSITINVVDISTEIFKDMLTNVSSFEDFLSSYCRGYIDGRFRTEIESEAIRQLGTRGVYIDEEYYEYLNAFMCEKEIDGRKWLIITKSIYLEDGQQIIATLILENTTYDYYRNGENESLKKMRDCFESIEQS